MAVVRLASYFLLDLQNNCQCRDMIWRTIELQFKIWSYCVVMERRSLQLWWAKVWGSSFSSVGSTWSGWFWAREGGKLLVLFRVRNISVLCKSESVFALAGTWLAFSECCVITQGLGFGWQQWHCWVAEVGVIHFCLCCCAGLCGLPLVTLSSHTAVQHFCSCLGRLYWLE